MSNKTTFQCSWCHHIFETLVVDERDRSRVTCPRSCKNSVLTDVTTKVKQEVQTHRENVRSRTAE